LFLEIDLPEGETMQADSLKYISISTKNSMGEFEKAKVTFALYKLETPNRLIRERYWEQPDQFLIKQEDYLKDFPLDEYNNESKKENWKRGEIVLESTDSSSLNGKFDVLNEKSKVKSQKLQTGWYVIEAITKDKNDNEVKNISFIQLTDAAQQPVVPDYVWDFPKTITKEPGQSATFTIGSSATDVFVIEQKEKDWTKEPVYSFLKLSNEKKAFTENVTENNRGGFGSIYSFVKHNRFYNTTRYVNVPYSNKELKISFETYRNKTLPGNAEEWKVKISGSKGEKVAAELLTSMYDASLDQFKMHQWYKPNLFGSNSLRNNWMKGGFAANASWERNFIESQAYDYTKIYDQLLSVNNFGGNINRIIQASGVQVMSSMPAPENARLDEVVVVGAAKPGATTSIKIRGQSSLNSNPNALVIIDGVPMTMEEFKRLNPDDILEINVMNASEAVALYGSRAANGVILIKTKKSAPIQEEIKLRKNFSETAFFFPQLQTDSNGNVILKFTMPESLTKWKWQLLSHTKDASFGIAQQEIITQKELMVQPFAPRFLREGDKFEFTAKVTNLTDKEITGNSQLHFLNASTMQPVDAWFQNLTPFQYFTVAAGQSTVVKFKTEVPYNFNEAVTYRIVAKANDKSDGEEMTLPVLTNRMLVTESLPLNMRGEGTKNFTFTKLLNTNSQTLQHHKFTVEFTSNPVWYAVQALPYMMEYPYECAEQTWNRFYANALAHHIVSKMPKIKAVFEQWKTKDTAALLSNLQKNEELKAVLLAETPWVLQAKNEEQQKKNIALLFDMVRMSKELDKALNQLQQMQSSNGGFVWFKGGPDDRYITQYIVTGIGHLMKLKAMPVSSEKTINTMLAKAIPYLDKKLTDDHEWLKKQKVKLHRVSNTGCSKVYTCRPCLR
jgi:TonB-dependent SusC/RagA subfamily outer membrane receptor